MNSDLYSNGNFWTRLGGYCYVSRSLSKTDSLLTNNIKNSMSIEEKRNTRTVMDMTEILNCLFNLIGVGVFAPMRCSGH